MEMKFEIMSPAARKYTYAQSSQLSGQCGLIGHLRGDMDTNEKGFFTTWEDYRTDLKTDTFKAEFDEAINALRFGGEADSELADRAKLASYCYAHPDTAFERVAINAHGSLFLDAAQGADFTSWHSLVYGHNMKDGSMFHSIKGYADQELCRCCICTRRKRQKRWWCSVLTPPMQAMQLPISRLETTLNKRHGWMH